jgi:hypothetical protein
MTNGDVPPSDEPRAPSVSLASATVETAAVRPSEPPAPKAGGQSAHARASDPPSEPRGASRTSFGALDLAAERPARLQMIVALVLGLLLVAIPLYLWRRPRAESIAAAAASSSFAAEPSVTPGAPATSGAPLDERSPTLGEVRSLQCQDPGSKKTTPEQCDHLVEIEKALAKAIVETAGCVPRDAGGGTVEYVADVSFKRKAIHVLTPKDGRSMKNARVVAACQSAVKSKLQSTSLDGVTHAHARYRIALTASYPGPVK